MSLGTSATTASSPRRRIAVHFSSATDEWATPQAFFDELDAEFHFTLDVCATSENAKCPRYFTRSEDGLAQPWGQERCWMNPPYGRAIGAWMRKAYEASNLGALVVCLIPARTDTAWWHDYAAKAPERRFVRGRLRFGDANHSAPFPSVVVIFRPRVGALSRHPAGAVECTTKP
jgi:site-specific DNA-methyltransferase (adenine-specific)